MPGQAMRLGPFQGGINTLSDPSAVRDSELVDCINFELDLDGSLQSRPPITTYRATTINRLLGFYIADDGKSYLFGVSTGNVLYYITTTSTVEVVTFAATAMVQYQGKAWFVRANGAGGKWDPINGFVGVSAIPAGVAAVVHKERIWIIAPNSTRVNFSAPGNFESFPGSNYFFVGEGDGQKAVDIVTYNGDLMIFKTDSTWSFSFESDPGRGVLVAISNTIGASHRDCVAVYETTVFVCHEGYVYELVNYNFTRINFKVPFKLDTLKTRDALDPVSISILGDRLFVRYFDRAYVFGLRTRSWTRWQSTYFPGRWYQIPSDALTNLTQEYVAANQDPASYRVLSFKDTFDTLASEKMTCYVKTRNYDYQLSHGFKRLYWWGIDIVGAGVVNAQATPISYGRQVTWKDLEAYTWADLETNTWDQPLTPNLMVETIVDASGGAVRKFIKLLKALRFRQIFFEASIDTNGTSPIGEPPVRLFNFITVVGTKQNVSKQIS